MERPSRLLLYRKRRWWRRKDARRREVRVRRGDDGDVHPTAASPGVKLLTDSTGVRQNAGPSGK